MMYLITNTSILSFPFNFIIIKIFHIINTKSLGYCNKTPCVNLNINIKFIHKKTYNLQMDNRRDEFFVVPPYFIDMLPYQSS